MIRILLDLLNYLLIQFRQIAPWWLAGAVCGALVTVFAVGRIGEALGRLQGRRFLPLQLLLAAALGAASPLCMYGTIPLIYSFGKKGVPQHLLAAFMASSILINPNLFAFSFALGVPLALLRLAVCLLAGISAGLLVKIAFRKRPLYNFDGYMLKNKARPDMKPLRRVLHEINGTIVWTAPYILAGIALTALFEEFVPKDLFHELFAGNRGFGVLLAAGLGVPVYVCGGGTIPLIAGWLDAGMSPGSAVAFMVTGPATKFSNLSAVKAILGKRNFLFYVAYMIVFSILSGFIVDIIYTFIR